MLCSKCHKDFKKDDEVYNVAVTKTRYPNTDDGDLIDNLYLCYDCISFYTDIF